VLKKLDIYIIKKFLSSFFFTMLLISMMAVVIDFSEKVHRFIDNDLSVLEVLTQYYLPFIPWINGLMWPLFSLIAVIFFTSRLAKNSEIVASLSSGISINRIMVPYLISAFIIAGLMWFGKNYLIPHSCKLKNDFENEYLTKKHQKTLNSDVHLYLNPSEKVYIRYYKKRDSSANVFRLEKFEGGKLVEVLKAEKMEFKSEPNEWTLKDYERRRFTELNESIVLAKGETIDTVIDLTPEDFIRNNKIMENMTTGDLVEYISREQGKGLNTGKNYLVEYHQRHSQPFSIIVLTIIGFAVASRKVRGGMGLHLALGVIIGAAFVLISEFSATFSINLSLSPAFGAWLPNIIFGIIAIILLRFSQK